MAKPLVLKTREAERPSRFESWALRHFLFMESKLAGCRRGLLNRRDSQGSVDRDHYSPPFSLGRSSEVERTPVKRVVAGSNPAVPAILVNVYFYPRVAQLVEHSLDKAGVGGSSPSPRTILLGSSIGRALSS